MRKQPLKLALTVGFLLAITFTFSCSGDSGGGGGDSGTIKREKISGVCEKGPFAKGSVVKIYELNAKFEKTKNSFEGKTDGKGYFEIEIKNGKLASPYIVLEVSGKYMNEVSGKLSTTPITLNAVADVSDKSKANVNVLTDLEFDKVMKQVKSGTKFEDAKKEAQKEVLNALGVSGIKGKNSEDISLFGSSPSDSVLLAVSVLLQGDRSTEEVSDLLADISSEIEKNGTLSNSTKSEVANGLADVDMDKVRDNILSLNPDAKVPDFDQVYVPSSSSTTTSNSSVVSSSSGTKSSNSESKEIGQIKNNVFTDPRDGKKYKIEADSSGTIWMSENLNYSRNNTLGYCYGVDIDGVNPHRDSTTCDNGYGRIYKWAEAMDGNSPQGLCPNGWYVPSPAEWRKIESNARKMSSGFYIYPGHYNLSPDWPPFGWKERDSSGFYWTSNRNNDFAGFWDGYLCKGGGDRCLVEVQTSAGTSNHFSVRCVMKEEKKEIIESNVFTDTRDGKKYKFEANSDGTVWMSENLNYSKNNTLGYCYGVDIKGANPHKDSTSCNNGYGRNYEWAVAMNGNSKQGLCPNGWHVPDIAEWRKIPNNDGGGGNKMSKNFYICPGNYNTNVTQDTIINTRLDTITNTWHTDITITTPWRERDQNGFYWTSLNNNYFVGFWSSGASLEIKDDALDLEYFSVRCAADNDLKFSCGTATYDPATQFCYNSKIYALCGSKSYIPGRQVCDKGKVYNCGGSYYCEL